MSKWLCFLFLLSITSLQAQVKNVVKWDYQINKIDNSRYEAVLTAKIEKGWHLYSKDIPHDSGIPTKMKITTANVEPVGDVQEIGKKTEEFSQAFGVQIVYYSDSAKFVQAFTLKDAGIKTGITAEIIFQVCNDRICLAPNTLEFEKPLNGTDNLNSAGLLTEKKRR